MAGYAEIFDVNHHAHTVHLICKDEPFSCSGCKVFGFNLRYACQTQHCNHQYHKACILQRLNTRVPAPFYKHDFFFHKSIGNARCEACGMEVLGYVFYCPDKAVSLHPCCADLPRFININARMIDSNVIDTKMAVQLTLEKKIADKCRECNQKNLGTLKTPWAYISRDKKIQVHVACIRKALLSQFEGVMWYGRDKPRMMLPSAGASTSTAIVARDNFPVIELDIHRRSYGIILISAALTGNHVDMYMAFYEYFRPR